MDNLNGFSKEDDQVNEEKPPPRACARCKTYNTRFCYYNNRKVSQPRYFCKKCRRHWTHGGVLRNMPVFAENQPVIHQPFRHTQENSEFVGSFGGSSSSSSSSSYVIGNHVGYMSELHGVSNVPPAQSFQPIMDHLNLVDELFQQDYSNVGSNDLIGNPFINQPIGEYVDNHNSFCLNQVDQYDWSQIFHNTMDVNHKASSSGSSESSDPR